MTGVRRNGMRGLGLLGLLGLLVVGSALQAQAVETCRQALALGLDVSSSVNSREYRLQLDGLASALDDPDVVRAFLAAPGAYVRVMVYEWSGARDQRVLVGWREIRTPQDLAAIATTLRATGRVPVNPATALGNALVQGGQYLGEQVTCWKRTLDISGDGKSNTGPRPQDVEANPALAGVTVNALVIGSDAPDGGVEAGDIKELEAYFRAHVIRGAGAFAETANGFEDYSKAMTRKLLRELEGLALSAADRAAMRG